MDREGQQVVVRTGTKSALLGVMMIAVCIVLSYALPTDDQQEVRLGLAIGVSMSPMVLLSWWLFRPTKVTWPPLVLQLPVCAALAVGSFWLWQRAEQPIVAFVFGVFYAMLALMRVACQIAISRLQAASSATGASGSQPGFDVQAEPEGRNEPASESA
jgi:hypothetical protein